MKVSIIRSINNNMKKCIIVDIDGTLAYMDGRTPFEYHKVRSDLPNKNLIEMLSILEKKYTIIILTGREDICLEETEAWLKDYKIKYDEIYIRKTGDNRCDTIVKKEIYEAHIKNRYHVLCVLDDRPRLIRMWKDLGLFVMDCNRQDSRVDF